MSFHNRAVDHVETVRGFSRQRVEHSFPDAAPGPAVEAVIGRRIRPVALRQVPPRHPGAQHVEDRVQDLAVVNPPALPARGHQRLQKSPFLVDQIMTRALASGPPS